MSTVSATLQMFDMMTKPLQNMMNALNIALETMDQLANAANSAVNVKIDVSGAMDSIAKAEAEMKSFQEQINRQTKLPQPPGWESYQSPEIFNTTGIDRMKEEIMSLDAMMADLQRNQSAINSSNMQFMPANAVQDLDTAAQRIGILENSIRQMEEQQRQFASSMKSTDASKFNSSLEQLRAYMHDALQSQQELNIAMQQGDIRKANNSYEKMMQNIDSCERHIRDNIVQQDNFNKSVARGGQESNGLLNKIKSFIGNYIGLQSIKSGIDATIGGAMKLQQQLFNVQGIMGNKDIAAGYFDNLTRRANNSAFTLDDYAGSARKFMQFTKNTNSMDRLLNLNERLTLADPTQGFEGAGSALKEAMSGNFTSLQEKFGFGNADAEILKASKDMDDFINNFDNLLNKKGLTEGMLAQYNQSASAQFDNLKSNLQTAMAQAGNNSLEILTPVMSSINQAFSSGAFQPFFDSISSGIAGIVNIAIWLGKTIYDNWGIIKPIILGIVFALIAYNAVMGIGWLTTLKDLAIKGEHAIVSWLETAALIAMTAAQQGLNAALALCPITWIIVAIIALIAIFYAVVGAVNHFTGTSISATGMIVGAIAVAGAAIWNIIIGVINAVIQYLWTRFCEPFIGIIEWVLNVANGGFNGFGGAVANLIGQIISWFLSLGKVVTKIIDAIFGTNWTSGLKSLQDSVLKWGKNDNAITLDRTAPTIAARIDYGDAYNSGYNWGEGIGKKFSLNNLGKIPGMPEEHNFDDWNMNQGLGELSMNVKDINNKIDVSNEHLEILRDLAEQESIQNFVTLTPMVQVTTGDIREEADINKIIAKIENYMETELANSAEGVYA